MTVFVDTSAFYALLDLDDPRRPEAIERFERLQRSATSLVTHSYVLVETVALLQSRLGLDVAAAFHDDLLPLADVQWVDAELHRAAWTALRAARRRHVSLVDHVSFELMRRRRLETAFAFDEDFESEGFSLCR